MVQLIRDVSQLPDWFDIEPYTQWQDKNPHDAAYAVDDRFWFWRFAVMRTSGDGEHSPHDEEINTALEQLALAARNPFKRFAMQYFAEIHKVSRSIHQEPEVAAELDERDREEKAMEDQASSIAKEILGNSFYSGFRDDVSLVTLWDAMNFMENNAELIARLERAAQLLADKNGWEFEEVRDTMFMHTPMYGEDGSSFITVEGYPTIDAQVQAVRRYLVSNYADEGSMPKVRPSEVRKLFDYRAAAYADLQTWACLTRSKITAKCMAQALFPNGRFGELDMRPSRTVGGFFQRLEQDQFYLDDLVGKAAEMETLQF